MNLPGYVGQRVAVVSGSSRGFGAAITASLRASGWYTIGIARSPRPSPGQGLEIIADVAATNVAADIVVTCTSLPVHLLVNNAAAGAKGSTLEDIDPASLASAFAVNVIAPLRLTQALLPNLAAARGALVVNVSSRLASLQRQAIDHYDQAHRKTSYAYRITKAAQNMASIGLAHELTSRRIAVWALHPGRLATGLASSDADTSPDHAATRFLQLLAQRDPDHLTPRFISLDHRETPDGADLPW